MYYEDDGEHPEGYVLEESYIEEERANKEARNLLWQTRFQLLVALDLPHRERITIANRCISNIDKYLEKHTPKQSNESWIEAATRELIEAEFGKVDNVAAD